MKVLESKRGNPYQVKTQLRLIKKKTPERGTMKKLLTPYSSTKSMSGNDIEKERSSRHYKTNR